MLTTVSTDKQGIKGLGMDAQREAVARLMAGKGEFSAQFIEVDSGRKDNRSELYAALAECRSAAPCWSSPSLTGSPATSISVPGLMNSDVEFIAVDITSANRLTIHILAAVTGLEREMISLRAKAALPAAKATGTRLNNRRAAEVATLARAPKNKQAPRPEVLKLMTEWKAQGRGLREITRALNGLNIGTRQGKQ